MHRRVISLAARIALAALPILVVPASAVTPYLVKDINRLSVGVGSSPGDFASLGGRALFFAEDGLWSSDGSESGTIRLGDFFSRYLAVGKHVAYLMDRPNTFSPWVTDGTEANTRQLSSAELQLSESGTGANRLVIPDTDRLFFAAFDRTLGTELWVSDTTVAGTHPVANLFAGSGGSNPSELTSFRNRVSFVADDGRGVSLWSTDGTEAGTRLVKDIDPLARQLEGPRLLRANGQTLYFFAPSSNGWYLWKSDGSERGTVQVARVAPRGGPADPVADAVVQLGRLFFIVDDGRNGREIWSSNGTAAGTRPLTRFAGSADGPAAGFPLQIPGRLLFAAFDAAHGSELWASNGTPAGTRRVKDICPGPCSGLATFPQISFRGRLYFQATTPARGTELWSTDGTEAGTTLLKDVCRGSCASTPVVHGASAGQLFFDTIDDRKIVQLWRTDGTPTGTIGLARLGIGDLPEGRFRGAIVGGSFLFGGFDPIHGRELWRTDGTPAGTSLLADLGTDLPAGSEPSSFLAAGARAVFLATGEDQRRGLWATDGTEAGTAKILETAESVSPLLLFKVVSSAHFAYFIRGANGDNELWRTDGSESGTFRVTPAGIRVPFESPVLASGDRVFFVGEDDDHGEELWTSDGSPAGTHLVADLDPGPRGSRPTSLAPFLGGMVFEASTFFAGTKIYLSDGTPQGTREIFDRYPFLSAYRLLFRNLGQRELLERIDDQERAELWVTDGTEAGTQKVIGGLAHLEEIAVSDAPGGHVLFRAGTSAADDAIYLSDGTVAGTRRIAERLFTSRGSVTLTAVGGRFVFSATPLDDSEHTALWVTDGTAAGTFPLIETGSPFEQPIAALPFAGRLLLPGSLFRITDGTPEGTSTVPGFEQTPAVIPRVVGDRAYFPLFDPATGTEPWALRPD